jgi:hypothetical protein
VASVGAESSPATHVTRLTRIAAAQSLDELAGPCPPAFADRSTRRTALALHHQIGAIVDRRHRGEPAGGQLGDKVGQAAFSAGDRHLVGLGEMEHDISDRPPGTARRSLPAGLVESREQRIEIGMLAGQGGDDRFHAGSSSSRVAVVPGGRAAYRQGVAPETSSTSISEAITMLRGEGFTGDFAVVRGALRCGACAGEHEPAAARIERIVRIEGVTDPADEAIVFGLACTRCGCRGVLVAAYGHGASSDEAAVMLALTDDRR